MATASALVRKYFSAYEAKDRKAMEEILSNDFIFTSPLDGQINRSTYFLRCWPNSGNIRAFVIEKVFEEGDEAFIRYESQKLDGEKFRNTEFFRTDGEKIKEVQVYFGSAETKRIA